MDFIVDCFIGVVVGWLYSTLKLIVCCFIGVWVGWSFGYRRMREIQCRMEESQHNIIKDSEEARMILVLLPHCTENF